MSTEPEFDAYTEHVPVAEPILNPASSESIENKLEKYKQKSITTKHTYFEEDLRCVICMESLSKHIYRCNECNIRLCEKCKTAQINTPCCVCDSATSVYCREFDLENDILEYLVDCSNKHIGCNTKLLPWDIDDHNEICNYGEMKCLFCGVKFEKSINCMLSHFSKKNCDREIKLYEYALKHKNKCNMNLNNIPVNSNQVMRFKNADLDFLLFIIPVHDKIYFGIVNPSPNLNKTLETANFKIETKNGINLKLNMIKRSEIGWKEHFASIDIDKTDSYISFKLIMTTPESEAQTKEKLRTLAFNNMYNSNQTGTFFNNFDQYNQHNNPYNNSYGSGVQQDNNFNETCRQQ
jgi:hypothetical protein